MLKNLSFYVVTFSNFFNIFWGESIFFSTNEFLGKGTLFAVWSTISYFFCAKTAWRNRCLVSEVEGISNFCYTLPETTVTSNKSHSKLDRL